jgi:aspartate aminotransferase-like enzyme
MKVDASSRVNCFRNSYVSSFMSYKLFIPGPIAVSEKTLRAMAQAIQPELQALAYTKDPVYLSTSSAFGSMEGAIRNLVKKKVLCCMNGAFADKWADVAVRCGKQMSPLKFDWGQPVDPAAVRRELATGAYDAVTLIHNETSCGCMSDLPAIMAVIREFPDVISIVDTVSSFSALPIKKDELGMDVMITGSQKALALPPGLSFISASKRALERAAQIPDRGYYFDFLEFQKNHEAGMTPSTPVISLIYALKSKLEDIKAEGFEARFARHKRLNEMVRGFFLARGYPLFPKEGYGSVTLNCFVNSQNIDLGALNKILKSKHKLVIDGGYGKLKGKTFRISNMGDETDESIAALLQSLDSALAETPKAAAA